MEVPHIDRLLYLYSESNAEEADVVSFWEGKIYQFCVKHGTFKFTVHAMLQEFTVNDVYPSSLVPVFTNLKSKSKRIALTDELLSGEVDVLQSLFSSMWSSSPDATKQHHASLKLLSDAQECLLSIVSTLEDRVVFVKTSSHHPHIFSYRGILATATKKNDPISQLLSAISEEDSELLLHHMVKCGRAVLSADGEMVKFIIAAKKNVQSTKDNGFSLFSFIGLNNLALPVASISETEEAALRMKSSIYQVETKVEELRVSIQQLLDKARKCKADNDTKGALFHLSCKRSREQVRDRLIQSFASLVEAQDAIGQCNINILLTDAYRTAAQGLKSSRKEANLTAESAAEAMDAFQEEMDEMADISAVLNGGREAGAVGATEEEQQELEAELAALMKESASVEDNIGQAQADDGSGAVTDGTRDIVSMHIPAAPTQAVTDNQVTTAVTSATTTLAFA